MPTVVFTVDCNAANFGRCYTRELVDVAEEYVVPLTWLIFVSEKDPMSNINLYHAEYFHRIPSWHEMGLLLAFENSNGYVSDPKERGDIVRVGKDVLKQCHVKPTAFRAHRHCLLAGDLKHLEDIGILVDASVCPGAKDESGVTWPDGLMKPYRPSYENLSEPGSAKILMAPLATHRGVIGYLDLGWEKVQPVVEHSLAHDPYTVLALSDHEDCVEALRKTLAYCKQVGARPVTLTELATLN